MEVLDESIRPVTLDDAEQIAEIYNYYVLTSTITFEEEPVAPAEMTQRISEIQATPLPWLVATRDHRVTGFAYAHKWKARAAYRYSTEVTVYVRTGLGNSGTGSRLYARLFAALKAVGAHAVIGGVALPNEASLRLHQKFGFEKVAHFKEVGFKFNRWIDVTYWQLTL
ncbi:MAG TPA: arsinothricin resistance N-acetyltransferase ArsN1 family B [Steroidobacter sp.]|uniref:arsinothricin resistance N-acetyltransferase ArsN1 family B n=1 Tax=Steroidobacter sp. TaxID=1978227 RepID=UPI002EDB39F7